MATFVEFMHTFLIGDFVDLIHRTQRLNAGNQFSRRLGALAYAEFHSAEESRAAQEAAGIPERFQKKVRRTSFSTSFQTWARVTRALMPSAVRVQDDLLPEHFTTGNMPTSELVNATELKFGSRVVWWNVCWEQLGAARAGSSDYERRSTPRVSRFSGGRFGLIVFYDLMNQETRCFPAIKVKFVDRSDQGFSARVREDRWLQFCQCVNMDGRAVPPVWATIEESAVEPILVPMYVRRMPSSIYPFRAHDTVEVRGRILAAAAAKKAGSIPQRR